MVTPGIENSRRQTQQVKLYLRGQDDNRGGNPSKAWKNEGDNRLNREIFNM